MPRWFVGIRRHTGGGGSGASSYSALGCPRGGGPRYYSGLWDKKRGRAWQDEREREGGKERDRTIPRLLGLAPRARVANEILPSSAARELK